MHIEAVLNALLKGKAVRCGNIYYRIEGHKLESRYKTGSWNTTTELLNRADWIGTENEIVTMEQEAE